MICAFYAELDFRDTSGVWRRRRGALDKALLNYSPQGCDLVSVYAYAPAGISPLNVDWSMQQLMPDIRGRLRLLGWQGGPFIATPMAFSAPARQWFGPTADQLRSQIVAFCGAGASALMPFTWHLEPYDEPKFSLGNDVELRRGFAEGLRQCKAGWSS
jgi:hypothetical protein